MAHTITFKGNTLHLVGTPLAEGTAAPRFSITGRTLEPVKSSDFEGKTLLVTTFPSLDTPVCDLQLRTFNERAAGLSPDIAVLAVSMDLPFAQERFCAAHGIERVTVASDYQTRRFTLRCGLMIKELGLTARSAFIVDAAGAVRYIQIVPEITEEPDYDQILAALGEIAASPAQTTAPSRRCVPCESGTQPFTPEDAARRAALVPGWKVENGVCLTRSFSCNNFNHGALLFDAITAIAEEQGHHPIVSVSYNRVSITLTTHAAAGLTENDFIMAGLINRLDT